MSLDDYRPLRPDPQLEVVFTPPVAQMHGWRFISMKETPFGQVVLYERLWASGIVHYVITLNHIVHCVTTLPLVVHYTMAMLSRRRRLAK